MRLSPGMQARYDEIRAGIADYQARGSDGASAQVSEFSQHTKDLYLSIVVRELADLQERAGGKSHLRTVLVDPADRRAKLAIESGYDIRRHVFLHAPLEPWTCQVNGSARLYAQIMMGDDGITSLADYKGQQITALKWMRDEELIAVDEDGRIRALSDARPADRRAYPGAPCNDRKASIGKYLRHHARGLVMAAFVNICLRRPKARIGSVRRDAMDRPHGIALSAYDLAREANAIKAGRRDLDDYRYLSVSTVRGLVKELLKLGDLLEAEPPKAVRISRSWRTLPRVFELPSEETAAQWSRSRRRRKP